MNKKTKRLTFHEKVSLSDRTKLTAQRPVPPKRQAQFLSRPEVQSAMAEAREALGFDATWPEARKRAWGGHADDTRFWRQAEATAKTLGIPHERWAVAALLWSDWEHGAEPLLPDGTGPVLLHYAAQMEVHDNGEWVIHGLPCPYPELEPTKQVIAGLYAEAKRRYKQAQAGGRPKKYDPEFDMEVHKRVSTRFDWYPSEEYGQGPPSVDDALWHLVTEYWPEPVRKEQDQKHYEELRKAYERARKRVLQE